MTNSTEAEVTRLKKLIRKGYWNLARMIIETTIFLILAVTFLDAAFHNKPDRDVAFEFFVLVILLRLETRIK